MKDKTLPLVVLRVNKAVMLLRKEKQHLGLFAWLFLE